jgi:hypothetical protein
MKPGQKGPLKSLKLSSETQINERQFRPVERREALGFYSLSRKFLGLGALQRPIALVTATSPRAGDFL